MEAGLPDAEFANPGPLRDKIIAAILSGAKTATCSLRDEYRDEPFPFVGQRLRLIDSAGEAVGVIEVTATDIVRIADVTDEFAHAEGEGFASAVDWRDAHVRFWSGDGYAAGLGITLDDDTAIVREWIRLVS